jgi:hypothetical protein
MGARRCREMIRILRGPAAALLAVLVLSTGASAAPGDCRLIRGATTPDPADDVRVCEQQTYFHRTAAGLANFNAVPTFNATAPTASDAAAYAALIGTIQASPQNRPTFQGNFTGNIDTIVVDQYLTIPVYQTLLGSYPINFNLIIDGTTVLNWAPAAGSEVDAPLSATSEEGVYRMNFAIKNLYQAMDEIGMDLGDDVQHTVRIQMAAVYWGDSNGVYWFDSTTRPSGLYFNKNKPAGVVFDALG